MMQFDVCVSFLSRTKVRLRGNVTETDVIVERVLCRSRHDMFLPV
jgi:hypothetical protein